MVISNFKDSKESATFDLIWKGTLWTKVEWPLHGLYNARNAAMAGLAAAFASGYTDPTEFDLSALPKFKGVKRRQDVLHSGSQCIVLEDFGHHPTAIAATLEGIRAAYPERELITVFEPRSNTSCTSIFQEAFTDALALADRVYIGAVHRAERIPVERRLDTHKMANVLSDKGKATMAFESNQDLLTELQAKTPTMNEAVLLFFTNGSFDGVQHKTAALFKEADES